MSLESFYHEVALRQASADRNNLKLLPLWQRRLRATLPPAAKWSIAVAVVVALAIAVWLFHSPINRYLLSSSPHPQGAADILAAVVHHAHPIARVHRLVLACARENNAHACMEAIRQALTVVQPQVAATWLKEKEVHALRINAYFEQFANDLENHPGRLNQQNIISTAAAVRFPQINKPEPHAAQTERMNANPPGGLMEHADDFKPSPINPAKKDPLAGPTFERQN